MIASRPPLAPLPGVTYVAGDLNDYPHLVETAQRYGVAAIVHTAAASGPMVRAEAPHEVCQWNVMGTMAVYEVARLLGLRRVVYCSSTAVYGSLAPGLIREERALAPRSVYGATKAAGELLGAAYGVQFGLEVLALRLGHVFGPRRTTACPVRELVRAALDGRALTAADSAAPATPFLYVTDAATALVAALDAPAPAHRVFNVALGRPYTQREIAHTLGTIIPGTRPEGAPRAQPADEQRAVLDLSRARAELGFAPQQTLESALRAYSAWLRAHPV